MKKTGLQQQRSNIDHSSICGRSATPRIMLPKWTLRSKPPPHGAERHSGVMAAAAARGRTHVTDPPGVMIGRTEDGTLNRYNHIGPPPLKCDINCFCDINFDSAPQKKSLLSH